MKTIVYKAGITVDFLREGRDTNDEYCEFRCSIKPSSRVPMPHYHQGFEEIVYGEKGIVSWTVNGKTTDIGPGEKLVIPVGAIHMFENKSNETVEFLCRTTPGNAFGSDYFEDIATVLNADGLPDFNKLQDIMKQYGLIPVVGLKRRLIFAIINLIRKIKS
ncbi:cupin domain-containing protein [Spirosoma endbachense]|uniref:Cupin domain-containing protein n=1 Tax=Spirosoma endbachense TaxID=2666025 RepID=A0A6P1W447_9BACT|nr:cupin domain-containing protein [Spirosoma endbachense]QHW00232.1 cupin domain-containing protein [Spirosoma endbachense]